MLLLFAVLSLLAPAWASDGALLVERARAALADERADEAMRLAADAIRADGWDWTAHRTYLAAAEQGGVLARAEADFADLRTHDEVAAMVWAWWRVRRDGLPLAELQRAAARVPDGDVALAWVAVGHDGADAARRLLPDRPHDEEVAWLTLRLDLLDGRQADAARRARRWLKDHADRPDVLDELWERTDGPATGALVRARRRAVRQVRREVADRWDDPLYLHRALRMLAAAGAHEDARAVSARIGELGLRPPLPRAPWNESMRRAMGRTLALSSAPELPRATRSELLDITRALQRHALRRQRPDVAIAARTALAGILEDHQAEVALAELLLEHGDADDALAAARRAVRLAAAPAPDDLARLDTARQASELAHGLAVAARALAAPGQDREAQGWAALAVRLDPGVRLGAVEPDDEAMAPFGEGPVDAVAASLLDLHDPSAWALRARAMEVEGHGHAAFAAWAVARALGADVGDALHRTYDGLATPEPAATAIAARWADLAEVHEARLAARQPGEIEGSGPRPRVGRAMPQWEATGDDGALLRSEDLEGQVYVLALWASWCGPCKLELPDVSGAVQALAAGGAPVTGLAVSVDAHEKVWRRAQAKGAWPALGAAWAPGLEERLRVPALPATFVVAADGTLVHSQLGYDEAFGARLEQILRRHAE